LRTTIILRKDTREKLKQIGKKKQTYDQIIADLINKQTLNPVIRGFGKIQSDNSGNLQDTFIQSSGNNVHELNKKICEALNCNAQASTEIQINTGKGQSINLSLCENCVDKFRDREQLHNEE
jgi:hypothetical protein